MVSTTSVVCVKLEGRNVWYYNMSLLSSNNSFPKINSNKHTRVRSEFVPADTKTIRLHPSFQKLPQLKLTRILAKIGAHID